ncbi:PPE domain-containing protein [Amycolatopsis orientalis]|uniref:PPE domain-containing protein n=1 Tax=Amycolatopsis orientalis TaxID=31958 RepID=UPI0004288C31|nr:PPE domain-containing protein [Amycolatopsis orientalis]
MVNVGQDDFNSTFSVTGKANRDYEAKRYSDTYNETNAGPGGNSLTAKLTAEAKAGQYSGEQAAALSQGQQFRTGLNPSEQRYEAVPHGELKNMVTQDLDPRDIDEKGELWNNQGNSLNTFSNAVRAAISKEGEHWQGDGAQAVTSFFSNISKWADTAGDGAYLASNRFSQSAAAATTAKNSMPEEIPFDRNAEYKTAIQQFASGNFAGAVDTVGNISAKQEQSFQAHQQAAQVMHTYDQSLFDVNSKQPTFAPPPEMGDSTTASGFSGGSDVKGFSGGPGPSSGPGPGTPGPGGPSGPTPGPGITTGGGHTGTPGPGQTFGGPPGSFRPGPAPGLAALNSPGPTGLGRLGSEQYRGKPGRTPSGPGGSAASRLTGGGGKSGGGFGRNGGSGNVAERLSGGKVSAGEAERLAGKGGGSGSGKLPEERVTRGGAAAAGKSGGPGAMGAGGPGGKGQKEEDKEKKAPNYLQEEDADVLFGGYDGETKPVPPVIGEKSP